MLALTFFHHHFFGAMVPLHCVHQGKIRQEFGASQRQTVAGTTTIAHLETKTIFPVFFSRHVAFSNYDNNGCSFGSYLTVVFFSSNNKYLCVCV
jgi:hypothetical protein